MNAKAVGGAAAAALGVAAVLGASLLRGGEAAGATSPPEPEATAKVQRRDLVLRTDVDGTLGYGATRSVQAAGRGGTITALPAEGSVVRRGEALFQVDGRDVRLLYGPVPLWRRIGPGVTDGEDVRQLERNLVALGYDPYGMTVDDHFDSKTAAGVRAWQGSIDVKETGAVEPGDAVFLPGARRIQARKAEVGMLAQPGQTVVETTGTEQLVSIDLDATGRSLVHVGAPVQVELPSGDVVQGQVASVGAVAESTTDETGQPGSPTVSVTVRLKRGAGRDGLDGAPVTVSLEQERAKNVLAVPIEALLALRGGGYGVELVGLDGVRSLTGVEVGTFADGWVEVRGRGIRKGATVVVAT